MLTAWVAWRLVKWCAVAWFTAGLALAVAPVQPRVRLSGALLVATTGLVAVWMAGYGMVKASGTSFAEPFVTYSLLASLVALGGAVLGALRPERAPAAGLVTFGLGSALGLMAARQSPEALWVAGAVIPGIAALAAAGLSAWKLPVAEVDAEASSEALRTWLAWVGRAEGISLLVLFGLYMPLKYGAHIEIDGGQGWVGWVHGVLFMLFVLALGVTAVLERLGVVAAAIGFASSLFPFGTFAFERWLERRRQAS